MLLEIFFKTVKIKDKSDDFLRYPRWIAVSNKNNKTQILIMSSFEANELCQVFKEKNNAVLCMLLPRMKKKQDLVVYFSTNHSFISTSHLIQLSLFSGSFYIDKEEEEKEFISFFGFCPYPRTEIQEDFLNEGKIFKNGYVPLKHREEVFSSQISSRFDQEPSAMIQKMISIRNHGIVPISAHHNTLFISGCKPLSF